MSDTSYEQMEKLIHATINATKMQDVGHLEQRMSTIEEHFDKHLSHEERAMDELNSSIRSLGNELKEAIYTIQASLVGSKADLKECSANLRRDIMEEVYGLHSKIDNRVRELEARVPVVDIFMNGAKRVSIIVSTVVISAVLGVAFLFSKG